jgi:heme/copper-type cytochrome/quinol oxidase subunit 2
MVKKLSNQMRKNKRMKISLTIFKTIIIMIMANMGNNKMKKISNMKEVNSQNGYFY